jgi:hypothetical protein
MQGSDAYRSLAVPPAMQVADNEPTLPAASDEREDEQLSMFARAGQLALPGAPAQIGLDRVAYAPEQGAPIDDSATAESSRPLGPHTEFSYAGDHPPTVAPLGFPVQLALELDTWKEAAQLALWPRLNIVKDLTHMSEWDRDGKCNRTRFKKQSDVIVNRTDLGAWSTKGTIKCGQFQTCPSCGPQKCREVATKLSIAFNRHLSAELFHDVWMLSLTIPHYADETAELVVDRLYAAWETFTHSPEWKRFAQRWGVVGRVRVLDSTHGGAQGSHPHFHVAIFAENAGITPEVAWTLGDPKDTHYVVDDRGEKECNGVRVMHAERANLVEDCERWGLYKPLRACSNTVRAKYLDSIKGSLVTAWERAVRASGARTAKLTDFRRKSVELTPSEHAASYFTKWGLADEVGASTSKSRNHLRLLDAVAAGMPGAAYLWKQWRRAVHQHALVTGLGAVVRRFAITDDDAAAWLAEQRRCREAELERQGTPLVKVPELKLVIRSHLYGAAMALGWAAVFAFVDSAALAGRDDSPDWLQTALDDFLWRHLPLARGSPDG